MLACFVDYKTLYTYVNAIDARVTEFMVSLSIIGYSNR